MNNRGKSIFCSVCEQSISSKAFSGHLRSIVHKNNTSVSVDNNITKINSAFKNRISSYRLETGPDRTAPVCSALEFTRLVAPSICRLIDSALANHIIVKINFELFIKVILPKDDTIETKSFATHNISVHQSYNFEELIQNISEILNTKIEEFQEKGSGWSLLDILYLEININKYTPIRGSSFIPLPKNIRNKKCCLNINNDDEFCFAWTVLAALYPTQKNANRTTSYPHFSNHLNLQNMTFPVSLHDISTFEKNNNTISVNIYGLRDGKIVGPLYKTRSRKENHINMLLLQDGHKFHYVLIKDLAKLVRSQVTRHHGKIFFCDSCLLFFQSANDCNNHVCGGVATVLPPDGSVIQFKNYQRLQTIPFVIYADFESLLEPCTEQRGINTVNVQQHKPAAFAYYIVCNYDSSLNRLVSYRGPDCAEVFADRLLKDVKQIYHILEEKAANPVPIAFDHSDILHFSEAEYCYLCSKLLLHDKVRDHCHFTGKYRGAAHSYCNLNFSVPKFVPIFFHNLAGYDCHLFIRELSLTPGVIKVIPKNKENYISFTKFIHIENEKFAAVRFVDSFKFLGTSLEQLGKNLDKNDFVHLLQICKNERQFDLICRKGVYPYEYMTTWDKYNESSLPLKTSFYSSLTNESISQQDYDHAVEVWECFKVRNLGDYTDLYVKSDVLLLADIFEKFRKTCKLHYGLDPAFYLTTPSFSFDAMLLKTKVKLELISNLEIIRMIQKGIRGGICLCPRRYAKSNNKYQSDYDPSKPSNFLLYIDCNNLYGFAMCSYLPHSDFSLLKGNDIKNLEVMNIPDDNEYGYILEVDLKYPEYLHDLHNDLPFCAENFIPPGSKNKKLTPNLYDKYNYVIHYVHLKKCIEHGLILKKVHRVIKFKQSLYLKEYIDLNTRLRQQSTSVFDQDLFKLFNNSYFGKTLEDTENRVDVRLVNKWQDNENTTKKHCCAEELIARPNFHSSTIFCENLVAIQMSREKVILDKPIYIGFSVLELSKSHMYDFHYSIMKKIYENRLSLCYTDTDSFLYSIKTKDFYEDLKTIFLNYFDTSNYPLSNIFQICQQNKKVPGLFKDELGGNILLEFVGLRSKLYSIKTANMEIKKAKGVKKSIAKTLKFSDYTDVLFTGKEIKKTNINFRSIKHIIFTQEQHKVALSRRDDKRFILKDNITTKSWGHHTITM